MLQQQCLQALCSKASVKGEKYSTTKHRIIGRIKRFRKENRVPYRVIPMKDFRKIMLPRNWKSLYREQKLRLQYNELAYAIDRKLMKFAK